MRRFENLALVGFMGAGKSTAGRLAAELLGFEFVDTDVLIEAQCGFSVEKIFAEQGEAVFRQLEQEIVAALSRRRKTVIATGGGLISFADNLASLRTHALIVCLWASPETVWERVKDQTHRPLLRAPDPRAKIRELLAVREPHYRLADALINTDQRTPREVAEHVALQFRLAGK